MVALVVGYILTTVITKPIVSLTTVINDISELNMSNSTVIPDSKDEVGKMGKTVSHMREKLSGIVAELNDIAEILVGDSDTLYKISETVNTNIQNMNSNVATVADKIQNGTVLTNEVMDKTKAIHQKTKTSSDETLRVYESIVDEVNHSVGTLIKCLVDALDFLENKVMNDYSEFMNSSEEYSEATMTIGEFMQLANNEINELKAGIMDISMAMEGISTNISECFVGINDIAEKTTNVVGLTGETYKRTTNFFLTIFEIVHKLCMRKK